MSSSDPYTLPYLIMSAESGVILRSGTCSAESFNLQPGPGQLVIVAPEGVFEETHYWNGSAFAEYPPRPGDWAEWTGTAWIDPRTQADLDAQLEAVRGMALARVNALRGAARLAYITDLPGQDALYMAKAEEAREVIALVTANQPVEPQDFPLVMSEVGITAPSPYEVAQVFLNLNGMWRHVAGMLDAACFQAQAAIEGAPDEATINSVVAALAANLGAAA